MSSELRAIDETFAETAPLAENPDSPLNRRGSTRHAFRVIQRIAPYDGTKMPAAADFCPAACRNISTQGFSFLWPEVPSFKHLILALGERPQVTYVAAEVARTSPMPRDQKWTLVGCRFLRRFGNHLPS